MPRTRALRWIAVPLLAMAISIAWGGAAQAVIVSYDIDEEQSTLFINTSSTKNQANPTGEVTKIIGVPVTGQTANALTDFYTGTIQGDLNAGVLTFSGGSSIVAGLNPEGPFVSTAYPGTDNYGFKTVAALPGYGVVSIALRGVQFDITAGSVQNGLAPAGMVLTVPDPPTSWASSSLPSPLDYLSLGGTGNNTNGLAASLTTSGGIETLVLPVTRITGSSARVVLIGTLVATRSVPEPSTITLGALGALGLAFVASRRRAK